MHPLTKFYLNRTIGESETFAARARVAPAPAATAAVPVAGNPGPLVAAAVLLLAAMRLARI